jgi:hypothetical protein
VAFHLPALSRASRAVAQRHPGVYLDVVSGLFPLLMREIGTLDERVEAVAGRLAAVPALLQRRVASRGQRDLVDSKTPSR